MSPEDVAAAFAESCPTALAFVHGLRYRRPLRGEGTGGSVTGWYVRADRETETFTRDLAPTVDGKAAFTAVIQLQRAMRKLSARPPS